MNTWVWLEFFYMIIVAVGLIVFFINKDITNGLMVIMCLIILVYCRCMIILNEVKQKWEKQ